MQPSILVTNGDENGGVHPRAKWARITADHIMALFDLSAAPEAKLAEVRAFEDRLIALLTDHHGRVKEHTRAAIRDHGKVPAAPDGEGGGGQPPAQASSDPRPHLQEPLNEILALARGTSFEPAFATPAVQAAITAVLANHFATSIEIEHEWHAHRCAGRAGQEHLALFGAIQNPDAVRFRHRPGGRRDLAAAARGEG